MWDVDPERKKLTYEKYQELIFFAKAVRGTSKVPM
jgi:hypothetical protein